MFVCKTKKLIQPFVKTTMTSTNSCFDFEIPVYLYLFIIVCFYIQKLRYKIIDQEDIIYKNNCVIKLLQKDIIDMQDHQNNIPKYRYAMF